MATGDLKSDLVNGAFSQMRISGLTVEPSPEDSSLALIKMEELAAELKARNVCTSYNLEDTPNPGSPHNLERQYQYSFKCMLAYRLLSDFGKGAPDKVDQILLANSNAQSSFLFATTAVKEQTNYPNRQPLGSGNTLRYYRYRKYYPTTEEAPISCKTNKMIIGDIDNFTEHFDAYLNDGESISSYTLEADTGLTVTNESLSSPDLSYTVEAVGVTSSSVDAVFQIKIVATTSDGRKTTRVIDFELTSAPEIE